MDKQIRAQLKAKPIYTKKTTKLKNEYRGNFVKNRHIFKKKMSMFINIRNNVYLISFIYERK